MRRRFPAAIINNIPNRYGLASLAVPLLVTSVAGAWSTSSTPAGSMTRVQIPMRDHVMLAANLFLPQAAGRHPTVLVRTPYNKGNSLLAGYDIFLRHGYSVVIEDVRGRYASGGVFDGMAREGPDGSDTIDWIARQSWSDGNVVMSGGSYLGFAQWDAALEKNPHLKAIFPVVSGCDPYTDRFYSTGGALKLGHRLSWLVSNLGAPGFHRPPFQVYVNHLPLRTSDRFAAGRTIGAFQKALAHPTYDAFWRKMSVCENMDRVLVPVFAAGGWYDNYVEGDLRAFEELSRLGRNPHLIIGPWPHNMSYHFPSVDFGPAANVPLKRYQVDWYDSVLKLGTRASTAPDIRWFVMGANVWKSSSQWPPHDTHTRAYYLAGDGRANTLKGDGKLESAPPATSPPDHFTYDPHDPVPTAGGAVCCDPSVFPWGPMDQRPLELRPDVLVYTTPVLKHDVEVTGPIRVELWVATSARDTDFTAKLVDVFPTGEARNLTDGILRLRYRNGLDRISFARPAQALPITIDSGVTSNLFRSGHRIRLEISSSNFPRFNRNGNTGGAIADETRLVVARQTVFHDARHASALLLPVVSEPTFNTSLSHHGTTHRRHP